MVIIVKKALVIFATILMALPLSLNAVAADYSFTAKDTNDFYNPTCYEDIYGSAYNYGGQNVTDYFGIPTLPGIFSPAPQAATAGNLTTGATGTPETRYDYVTATDSFIATISPSFTPASELKRYDGSIGTLAIPSLSISMKAYDGTALDNMAKGVGHFPETSGWNGNIGLCGHNRNARYTIGSIKDLRLGDIIEYTTILGTRRYSVSYVGIIGATDWSYLNQTSDNRITIITCLADQPSYRVLVQAIEAG